jgi:hypothetical protein
VRLKADGPLGFTSIYRPARSPQTRRSAGIASTHRLTAVAHACEARTGFDILASTRTGDSSGCEPSVLGTALGGNPTGGRFVYEPSTLHCHNMIQQVS